MPITIENRAGRVVEFRTEAPMRLEHWDALEVRMKAIVAPLDALIICADLSEVRDAQDAAMLAEFGRVLKNDNKKLVRSGVLVEPSPFMLQFNELVIAARNPSRRVLYTREALLAWLGPVLTDAEHASIVRFLESNDEIARHP